MASGITVVSKTTTSIRFSLNLSSVFSPDNYIRVGVCNFTFENGTKYWIENPNFNRVAWSTATFNDSNNVHITVYGLTEGTEYVFYGFAQAKNGLYYCVPYPQKAVIVSTKSGSSLFEKIEPPICVRRSEHIDDLSCRLEFNVTVPENTAEIEYTLASDVNFNNVIENIRYGLNEISVVPGTSYTYRFNIANLQNAATFYIRARANLFGEAGVVTNGVWSDSAQISTPPSRKLLDSNEYSVFAYVNYNTGSILGKYLRLYLQKEAQNYDFDYAVFMIYNLTANEPVEITMATKRGETSNVSAGTYGVKIFKSEITTDSGIWVKAPEDGTYLGKIHVCKEVGGVVLQMVDEYGDEYFEKGEITINEVLKRPGYFEWSNAKLSGGKFNLTAEEWNALTANINEVRVYKKLLEYGFTTVIKDATVLTGDIYNEARRAINELGVIRGEASAGGICYAEDLNDLKDDINSVE